MKSRDLYLLRALTFLSLTTPANSAAEPQARIMAFTIFNPTKRKAPISIADELGTSPTFQNKYFDPLNLANEDNFASLREAELKHGRVAMLAVLGNTLPDLFRDQIVPPETMLISPSNNLSFQNIPSGLDALRVVPVFGWFQIVLLIGILESKVFIQRDEKDMPGDYQLGYLGLRNKARHERCV